MVPVDDASELCCLWVDENVLGTKVGVCQDESFWSFETVLNQVQQVGAMILSDSGHHYGIFLFSQRLT